MAKAEKKTETIRRDVVELKLSIEEANVVFAVLGRVAGDPFNSPRKHVNAVYDALKVARVDGGDEKPLLGRSGTVGGLEFRPYGDSGRSLLDDILFGGTYTPTSKAWGRISG
jgi:hypothetical protein